MKLTDRGIKALKPKDKRYRVLELNGLQVRVEPSGTKSFYYVYRFDGKKKEIRLGEYGAITLEKAREEHVRLWTMRRDGKDPALSIDESRGIQTVKILAEDYIERYAKRTKSSWASDQSIMDGDVIPAIGNVRLDGIRRKHVQVVLNAIIDRGSPNQAWQTLKVVRKMFNWGLEQDSYGLEFNPASHIKVDINPPCDRNLSFDEIVEFVCVLSTCGIDEDIKAILRLILVTGQRPGEVREIHSREIDGQWWTIPKERIKTRRKVPVDHRVYLPVTAMSMLPKGRSGYLFSPDGGASPYSRHALDRALARLFDGDRKVALGIQKFTPNDLRRTMATRCGQVGLDHFMVDRVQNHVIPGVGAVYNRWQYDAEKREVLIRWSRELQKVVGPGWKGAGAYGRGKSGRERRPSKPHSRSRKE